MKGKSIRPGEILEKASLFMFGKTQSPSLHWDSPVLYSMCIQTEQLWGLLGIKSIQ